jgi:hypothetical protein
MEGRRRRGGYVHGVRGEEVLTLGHGWVEADVLLVQSFARLRQSDDDR